MVVKALSSDVPTENDGLMGSSKWILLCGKLHEVHGHIRDLAVLDSVHTVQKTLSESGRRNTPIRRRFRLLNTGHAPLQANPHPAPYL